MSLPPGTRLATYEILAPLGAGGMGEVYRARDPRLGREIAIKVLPSESLHDDTARARLLREARLAATLNHPNICTVYEAAEVDGQVYLAMELIDGLTLREKIAGRGAGLPTENVVRYGAQIAEALCSDPRFGEALLGGYSSTRRSRWSRSCGSRMAGECTRRSSSGNRSSGC